MLSNYDKINLVNKKKGIAIMKKELLEGLTEAQIERASKCKTPAELLAAAEEEGVELTEEQLKAINGGLCTGNPPRVGVCPQCKAQVNGEFVETTPGDGRYEFRCPECGFEWKEK